MGTAEILRGWALRGYFAGGHSRDTWWFGGAKTERILSDWILLGYSAVGHCRDAWWSGTVGMLCGWAPQSGSGRRARTT